MAGLIVLFTVLVAVRLAGTVLLWRLRVREPASGPRRRTYDPCLGPYLVPCPPPASDEGRLVVLLRSGRISRERYRREMARLARADARHPVR